MLTKASGEYYGVISRAGASQTYPFSGLQSVLRRPGNYETQKRRKIPLSFKSLGSFDEMSCAHFTTSVQFGSVFLQRSNVRHQQHVLGSHMSGPLEGNTPFCDTPI